MTEQTLILVDENDHLLGYAPRAECHTGRGRMHRAVLVVLQNAEGKLLIQLRKHALWDHYWDLSGATHPLHAASSDESYEDAAARLLRVEWGIAAPVQRLLQSCYYAQLGPLCENELCVLLAGRYDGVLAPNRDHAHDLRWATLAESLADLRSGTRPYTPWARIALERLAEGAAAGLSSLGGVSLG